MKYLNWRFAYQFSRSCVQQVDWRFVGNAVAVCVVQSFFFAMSFFVLCVGIANLPGSEFADIRTMAQQNLALTGVDALSQFSMVSALALASSLDVVRSIAGALQRDAGLEQDERQMMARCASVGWSLSQLDTEGWVAVSANATTPPVRIYRWADLNDFVSTQEEVHAPDSASDRRAHPDADA